MKINGTEHYYLSDKEVYELVKSEEVTAEEKEFLTNHLIERFKCQCCPKEGENNLNVFARQFSDFVNGKCGYNYKETAELLAKDHRYLQNEMFKVMLAYIKILAENYDKGWYDPRNEYACNASKHMIEGLENADYPY